MIKSHAKNVKCYLCREEAQLRYVHFEEFVCEKDYDKFMKFVKKLKCRKTRYKDINAWKGGHNL